MLNWIKRFLLIPGLILMAGCTTLEQQRQGDVRKRVEIQNMQVDLQTLRSQVNDLAEAQQDIYRRLDDVEASVGSANLDAQQRVSDLQRSIQELDAKRAADRETIVNSLSKQVTGLLQPHQSSSSGRLTGREHVVQQGENLSRIASAYKVTMGAIIKANRLKNPDAIRVGQKLFIPD